MRVALWFDRPYVDAHPCFREMAVQFAEHGWDVDLLMETAPTHPLPSFESRRIQVTPFLKSRGMSLRLFSRIAVPGRYQLVVVTPQWPLYWAVRARSLGRFRVVCLSDEVFVRDEANTPYKRMWKEREAEAHRHADITVSLSEARMRMVMKENGLGGDHPYVIIPNAPAGNARRDVSIYYRDRFSIPPQDGILVHSGTMGWTMARELAGFAADWEHPWSVIFQGRFTGANCIAPNGRHAFFEDRVFPAAEMRSITSSADIGLVLYDRSHPVEYRNGETPGKLGLYLSCGLPLICSNLDSLRWVSEEGCGVWVPDVGSIPAAAARIRSDYERYCRNAVRIFNQRFEYSQRFVHFLSKLAEVTGIEQPRSRGA